MVPYISWRDGCCCCCWDGRICKLSLSRSEFINQKRRYISFFIIWHLAFWLPRWDSNISRRLLIKWKSIRNVLVGIKISNSKIAIRDIYSSDMKTNWLTTTSTFSRASNQEKRMQLMLLWKWVKECSEDRYSIWIRGRGRYVRIWWGNSSAWIVMFAISVDNGLKQTFFHSGMKLMHVKT